MRAGELLATVAQRPVFVFTGVIPAFRTMSPGMSGPDVQELQDGLAVAGFGIGGDAAGVYGPGTAAAVAALYKVAGVTPVLSPPSGRLPALSAQVGNDQGTVSAGRAKLVADRHRGAARRILATDRSALAAAKSALAAAERAMTSAQRLAGSEVPLGEVAFVPTLPATVVSVARLGSVLGSGSGSGESSVAQLRTGRITIVADANPAQASALHQGMKGLAVSNADGTQATVRVSVVRGSQAIFVPVKRLPAGMAGQTLLVTVPTTKATGLIVPVAAVSTSGSGQTFVTVSRHGGTEQVPVRLRLASGGEQAVVPVHPGAIKPGDLVVLGVGTTGSGGG